MKDLLFSNCDMSIRQSSTDYVLDYLNFEEFNVENQSSRASSDDSNMLFDENIMSKEDLLLCGGGNHNFLGHTQPIMSGFDISYGQPKRTFQETPIVAEPENTFENLISFGCQDTYKKELSVASTKRNENLRIKYMKRNCDLGVDTSADPELKDTARNFVRTRGKPIKKTKKNLIKYELNKKTTSSQQSTKPSEENSISRKSSNPIDIVLANSVSQSSKSKKPSMLQMTVSEILKNDDLSSENMLLTFFTMKMANEAYFRNSSEDLLKLEETTKNIEKLRASMK